MAMSHSKCARLLSGNLNMEYSVASAVPLIGLYVNGDNIFGSGQLEAKKNYGTSISNVIAITSCNMDYTGCQLSSN